MGYKSFGSMFLDSYEPLKLGIAKFIHVFLKLCSLVYHAQYTRFRLIGYIVIFCYLV